MKVKKAELVIETGDNIKKKALKTPKFPEPDDKNLLNCLNQQTTESGLKVKYGSTLMNLYDLIIGCEYLTEDTIQSPVDPAIL